MGYGHSWRFENPKALGKALPLIAQDLRALLPRLPRLAGPLGKGKPILGRWGIAFNGPIPQDYEGFHLTPDPKAYLRKGVWYVGFCKTGRRPYDLVVQVALLLLKWHMESLGERVELRSDGNLLDWKGATELVEGLGYPVDPYWALGLEVVEVLDGKGRRFLLEWPKEGIPYLEGRLPPWLEDLHQRGRLPYPPPYRPLRVLKGLPKATPLGLGSPIYALGR